MASGSEVLPLAGQHAQHAFRRPPVRSKQERILVLRESPKFVLFPGRDFHRVGQRPEIFSIPTCDVLFQILERHSGQQTRLLAFLYDPIGVDPLPGTRARCGFGERVERGLGGGTGRHNQAYTCQHHRSDEALERHDLRKTTLPGLGTPLIQEGQP